MAWDLTLEDTEAILAQLNALGIVTDPGRFRSEARTAGSPVAMADRWLLSFEWDDPAADAIQLPLPPPAGPGGTATAAALLTAAAFELWKRWLPDSASADILAEEFDRHYEPLDVLLFGNPAAVREALCRALRIVDAVAPPGGPADQELFEEIWSRTYHDLALWLRCLPQVLATREMFDEAIHLCDRLAPVFDARAFLSDKALLLARCGRNDEARIQVAANVRAWRKDPVVLKKSCETLWALGHAAEALVLYDEVLEILGPAGARDPNS
jgi:hypothetical protein